MDQSARRQHFLPRFVLKGFASRSRGNSHRTHLFQKGRPPHEPNIINVAVAGDFYGREAGGGVESGLGESETQYATALDRIRKEGFTGLTAQDQLLLGGFVRQLLVRTRHMRNLAADVATTITAEMRQLLLTPQAQEHLERMAVEQAARDQGLLAQVRARGLNLTEQQMTYLIDLAMKQVNLTSLVQQYSDALAILDVPSAVAAGQIGGLRRAISERPMPPDDAVWSVTRTEPHCLILGDLAVIGRTAQGYCHLFQPDADLQAILVPISHQHLLVGALTSMNVSIDPEEVNEASVELSRDFFVASQNTERERRYQTRLAARAELSGLAGLLKQIALESLSGETRRGGDTPPSTLPS